MKDNNCTSQVNESPEADQTGFDEANLSGMVLLINGFEVDTATNSISKEDSES